MQISPLLGGNFDQLCIQPFWSLISSEDRDAFIELHYFFQTSSKLANKDRRLITFYNELSKILSFIERNSEHIEERSILCGVSFQGSLIAVNSRQLKTLICRCKSSINGSFQQLGYSTLRTKSKTHLCILRAFPSLNNFPNLVRQWTIRIAMYDSYCCFVSSYIQPTNFPEITPNDIYEDSKGQKKFSSTSSTSSNLLTPSTIFPPTHLSNGIIQNIPSSQQFSPIDDSIHIIQNSQNLQNDQNLHSSILLQPSHSQSENTHHSYFSVNNAPLTTRKVAFDLPQNDTYDHTYDHTYDNTSNFNYEPHKISSSMSLTFPSNMDDWNMPNGPLYDQNDDWFSFPPKTMPKSASSYIPSHDWDFFSDTLGI